MRLAPLTLGVLAVACQPYDFARVAPLTVATGSEAHVVALRGLKPNVMFLVDNSGSMAVPLDPAAAGCPAGCGTGSAPCPASCPTRHREFQRVLGDFLAGANTVARFGGTSFPSDATCGPPRSVDVALPPPTGDDVGADGVLAEHAQRLTERVAALQPAGGTPTAAALAFVGSQASLREDDGRDDYVVLLTDGLPNCNDANPAQVCGCDAATCGTCAGGVCAAQREACRCTTASCDGALCSRGCLDADTTVAEVARLRAGGLRTAVIGFGAEARAGDGPEVLARLARAGGFTRRCAGDGECGASRCVAGACEDALFLAGDGDELAAALRAVSAALPPSPCEFHLVSPPTDEALLAVRVDGEHVPAGAQTWRYEASRSTVIFEGELCARLTATTTAAPLAVEFRVAQRL